MNILFVTPSQIPVLGYGGRQRALWSLMKELARRGHSIKVIAPSGSHCPFAQVIEADPLLPLTEQDIPDDIDVVHFDFPLKAEFDKRPYIARMGGNGSLGASFTQNTIFVSRNQAQRHGGEYYIYNGVDAEDYGDPALNTKREYIHFLAKAAWRLKNLKDSIRISKMARERLEVIGGNRINFKMGFRITLDRHVHFNGVIGGETKLNILRGSKGLIFPVLWHEPCANAVFESLYYGCPVFATNWGFMPEIVNEDVGFLSNSRSAMVEAIKHADQFQRKRIHQYIMDKHSTTRVANNYLTAYEKVLNGERLNSTTPTVKQVDPRDYFVMTD